MKSYVNPVHLVTTRDGVCPDGCVEVQIAMGGESATEFLLSESQRRIRELEAALAAALETIKRLDFHSETFDE